MVDQSVRRVALLAIHPEHAAAILAGRKTVEFRKKRFHAGVKDVAMYATAPTQGIVGFFRVASIVAASPDVIWNKYRGDGAISRGLFRKYYAGSRIAVAIVIEHVTALGTPRRIKDIHRGASPPQSFAYLPEESIRTSCDEWSLHSDSTATESTAVISVDHSTCLTSSHCQA